MLDEQAGVDARATAPAEGTGPNPAVAQGPRREHAVQGALSDAWLIAVFGAVAGHRPESIRRAVRRHPAEGTRITLSEARPDPITADWAPTGREVRLEISDELTPVPYGEQQHHLYANTVDTGVVWPALLEKGFAALDTTWSRTRRVTIPTRGYARLDQEAGLYEITEALTQLTGTRAGVLHLEPETAELTLRYLLAHRRPVIVTTPPPADAQPHTRRGLEAGHAYEITHADHGEVHLRNPWGVLHPTALPLAQLLETTGGPIATLKD